MKLFHSSKITLFVALWVIIFAGNVFAECPNGDLDNDCYVGIADLVIFASQWLDPAGCIAHPDDCGDLLGSDGVDILDFTAIASNWMSSKPHLSINEFMASNNTTLADGEGGYDDWIEIYNDSDGPLDVGGMYLTDDLGDPSKWMIPTGTGLTSIPSKGYLLIWADDEAGTGLHAPFKLGAGGEEVGLYDTAANGQGLIDSVTFGGQEADIAYGRYPDGTNDLRFFGTPTPLAANNGAYIGEVADTSFNYNRGFYSSPIGVTITCDTPGASIYYTTDGSAPIENGVSTGMLYTDPIDITSNACIRAGAIKAGWMPTNIDTHTYIFNASNTTKSLPVFSIVGDEHKSLFEPDGIMAIVGGYYDGNGAWNQNGPDSYNNPMQRGIGYERPVSLEILGSQMGVNYQVDCGIRVAGSDWHRPRYTRGNDWDNNYDKFSFKLFFRNTYGDDELNYSIFPFADTDRFKSIMIRGGHNDVYNPFIKDEMLRRLHKDMGGVAVTGTAINFFLNGQYKSFYNPCERLDQDFFKNYYGVDTDWDVITQRAVRSGDSIAWDATLDFIKNNDLANNLNYAQAAEMVDIVDFIDYLIIQLYSANWDWPANNWTVSRERTLQGKFHFHCWDMEGTMDTWNLNKFGFDDFPSWWPGGLNGLDTQLAWIYRGLKANPEFKIFFADRIQKHFFHDGALVPTNIEQRFTELRQKMSMALPTMDTSILITWIPNRHQIMLDKFAAEGLFASPGPDFLINGSPQHGGYILAGDNLSITNPNGSGTLYYTLDGEDPRVSVANSGASTELTLVTENALKKVLIPSGPVAGGTGSISVEYWMGISGTSVSDLTNNGNYPNNPSSSGSLSSFEIPIDSADNYGTRVRGYLHPPSSGDYKFWIASDDSSQLWLSTDDDPANISQIAYVNEWTWSREWGKYASQVSSNISLTAGQTYYIEALQKDGTGGDNLAVAWEGPGFSQKVIEGADLSPIGESWTLINFDDTSWTSGTGGVGYENNPGDPVNYTALIDTDVKSAMYNVNPTCYIRIPFTISAEDLGALTNLSLNIRYDDGFIAYINGVKVAEDLADSTPGWDSIASGMRDDSLCDDVTEIDISNHIGSLVAGNNVLSIHGMNVSTGSSDFLITAELKAAKSGAGSVAPTAIEYTGGNITLNESTQVKARVLDGGVWSALNDASYGIGPVAESLRITEIMYHPANDPNSEFIELENIGGSPINLKLASFTNGVDFTFGSHILAGGDYVVAVRNLAAFNTAHPGFAGTIAGVYSGSLDNSGEPIKLEDAVGTTILDFSYKDGWYDITDGGGFSLTLLDSSNADPNSWSDKDSWTSSTVLGGTPGQADTGPKPGDIVINEVLAHSDTVAYDWIELYNTTGAPIDIGGWFLSDNGSDDPNLMKYEIAAGQSISGNSYKVFYEDQHFGSASSDPGRHIPFALSENGESVYLSSADGGVLSGYRETEDFGASQPDVSFGRYVKSAASGYDVDFVAMNARTSGSVNSGPKVGPVIISEIMYHPSAPDSDAEYVELVNISGSAVTLFDAATNEPWKFVDDYKSATPGIEYDFPTASPVTMTSGERILLVKDVAAFNAKFSTPGVQIFAWGAGNISNSGERLQVSMPGDIDGEGVRQYIRIDRVNFGDGSHPEDYPDLPGDPWPTSPDGLGDSLDRMSESSYGNDVANWQGGAPSPGS